MSSLSDLDRYVNFIKYCNEHIANNTEYSIIRVILANINVLSENP